MPLLAVPTLPRGVPLVRLEDAGMAEQMAEYVCLAVLRRYRELDAYAEQQRDGAVAAAAAAEQAGVSASASSASASSAARSRRRSLPFGFPLRGWSRTRKQRGRRRVLRRARANSTLSRRARRCWSACCRRRRKRAASSTGRRSSRLPRGAYVVNVARGALVVDDDLLALLDSGHLAGATLDVFRDEPLPPAHPFWHHPRITLTPHVSAVTLVEESVAQIAAKIRRLEAGLPVTGVVDPRRGY